MEVLQIDCARILGWGVAAAVLSARWSIEDGSAWDHALTCAEILMPFLK
jgi:streptomycin 6-kinase